MGDPDNKGNRQFCKVCGVVDEHYNEKSEVFHDDTPKHQCNLILANYKNNKSTYSKNRDGIIILCTVQTLPHEDAVTQRIENADNSKLRIYVKPGQGVKFTFSMANDMRNDDVEVVGILLAHPQPQFQMNDHAYKFGQETQTLPKKTTITRAVVVNFKVCDMGQYEMPILFTFFKPSEERSLIFVREMVVMVQEHQTNYPYTRSPYTNDYWEKADHYICSPTYVQQQHIFKIPKLLKKLLPQGIEENALEGIRASPDVMEELRIVLKNTRAILEEGITKENYMIYFHHLLWWEEIIARSNLRKYNMSKVVIERVGDIYLLDVPGLAEKRPSLLRGDRVFIRPIEHPKVVFETVVKHMEDCRVHLSGVDESFNNYLGDGALFDIHFMMSRVPMERMHDAVSKLHTSKQACRAFPVPNKKRVIVKPIERFYNKLIKDNQEQRAAVEHIVSGTSGKAPYIVFGPPGTGKTMTVVEAIIQLVVSNPRNRVLVCTDSNMAADHVAVMLLKYKTLNINNFLFRANSQSREWTVMPSVLAPVSNGTNYENFYSMSNSALSVYRIVVTTLSHAAKYSSYGCHLSTITGKDCLTCPPNTEEPERTKPIFRLTVVDAAELPCSIGPRNQSVCKLQMTHLFIDEAAQASEPATLVPICGLLATNGRLILAGDPKQLGPVCISREAHHRGLGTSLLERLKTDYESMYGSDPNYITMLVKNFRSDPDILEIPNDLFYNKNLEPLAKPDPLSKINILGLEGGNRAIVFHAIHSTEQRMGNAPSYFNERELDMLKKYIKALIDRHNVLPEDIGVIAPYIRQVYKMKSWLTSEQYHKIEVGTVESFQGKEKRVILVSTVRANCKLLDYDAKYSLGFLVDDKRFNVALTRAKAKLIIVGNPACLTRDLKWRKYMDLCKEYHCHYGGESQQIERDTKLHLEVKSRLDKSRLLAELEKKKKASKKK